MICRLWRGWTSPQNADAYERIVRGRVIPEIEAMGIEGFRHIDPVAARHRSRGGVRHHYVVRRPRGGAALRRRGLRARSHVPPAARTVLGRFDERAAHYDVLDRRSQPV
jgi:hypothetical protein